MIVRYGLRIGQGAVGYDEVGAYSVTYVTPPDWRQLGPPERGYPLRRSQEMRTWFYSLINSTFLPTPALYTRGVRHTAIYRIGSRIASLYEQGEYKPPPGTR
mgnify:CR=1 FL=1